MWSCLGRRACSPIGCLRVIIIGWRNLPLLCVTCWVQCGSGTGRVRRRIVPLIALIRWWQRVRVWNHLGEWAPLEHIRDMRWFSVRMWFDRVCR